MHSSRRSYIATWSGGKDSCLACYMAIQQGHTIAQLANFVSQEYGRVRFHGVTAELIRAQARAVGLPLLQHETSADSYEAGFKDGIRSVLSDTTGGLVFGDIHLQHCRDWALRVCGELGIEAIEPLWGRDPEEVLLEFIDSGFRAIVVSTQADLLGEEWLGREIEREFVLDLKDHRGVDLCGENGEYHTLVVDGPLFRERIDILESRKLLRDGYWFLDIQKLKLAPGAGGHMTGG